MKLSIKLLVSALVLCSARAFAVQGGAPVFQANTNFLDFNPTMVGGLVKSARPPLNVVITNAGTATLNISGATIASSEFFFSPASLPLPIAVPPGGSTMPFVIVFSPAATGLRKADLVVQDDAAGSPHTIHLTGFGMDVAPGDFALVPPDNNIFLLTQNIPAGIAALYGVYVTGGPNNITLSCSGAPQGGFCSLPPSATLDNASVLGSDSTVPVPIKVATSPSTSTAASLGMQPRLWSILGVAVGLALAASRKRGARVAILTFCAVVMTTGIVTCGTSNNSSSVVTTPAGTYTLTVTAKGNGGTVHTVPLTLVVRPTGQP